MRVYCAQFQKSNVIMPGSRFSLEVQPRTPAALVRLEELADDLIYSWDRRVRALFARLDRCSVVNRWLARSAAWFCPGRQTT